jgi:hypothetical protein
MQKKGPESAWERSALPLHYVGTVERRICMRSLTRSYLRLWRPRAGRPLHDGKKRTFARVKGHRFTSGRQGWLSATPAGPRWQPRSAPSAGPLLCYAEPHGLPGA